MRYVCVAGLISVILTGSVYADAVSNFFSGYSRDWDPNDPGIVSTYTWHGRMDNYLAEVSFEGSKISMVGNVISNFPYGIWDREMWVNVTLTGSYDDVSGEVSGVATGFYRSYVNSWSKYCARGTFEGVISTNTHVGSGTYSMDIYGTVWGTSTNADPMETWCGTITGCWANVFSNFPVPWPQIRDAYWEFGNSATSWPDGSYDARTLVGPYANGAKNNFKAMCGDKQAQRYSCPSVQWKTLYFLTNYSTSIGGLRGWKYKPVWCRFPKLCYPEHNAVVLWPDGKDWQTNGYILDAHPFQSPYYYDSKDNTWYDMDSDYEFSVGDPHWTTWDSVRSSRASTNLAPEPSIADLEGLNAYAVYVASPGSFIVENSSGQRYGVLSNGTSVTEYDPIYSYSWQDSSGSNQYFFIFSNDTYEATIAAGSDGTFELQTCFPDAGQIHNYGSHEISAGEEETVTRGSTSNDSLVLADGSNVTYESESVSTNTYPATNSIPVYRLYSYGAAESTYEHLWTTSETEKDTLDSWPSWTYEGIAWYAFASEESGTTPLYRLYEPNVKQHHYTISLAEYDSLTNTSWSGEGIQYYVYETNSISGVVPAYRFYHSGLYLHHFTISENEKESITNNPSWGYVYEGVGYYVFSTNTASTQSVASVGTVGASLSCAVFDSDRNRSVSGKSFGGAVTTRDSSRDARKLSYEEDGLVFVPGDYNGNGVEDGAYYEESSGSWRLLGETEESEMSNLKYQITPVACWGGPGFIPVSGDYDGDGVSDMAVYHAESGAWFIISLDGVLILWNAEWGGPGLDPVSVDHDGDGRNDLAVVDRRDGKVYIRTW